MDFPFGPESDFPMEDWTPPDHEAEDKFFEADDGVKLHYLDWGGPEGAPVVLMVHGRRAHARWFDPVVVDLLPKYRCLAFDLRGHGDSESAGNGVFSRWSADLAQFVNMFEGQERVLLAHSMAGRISLLSIKDHGLKPDAYILADTPIFRRPHHKHPEKPFKRKRFPNKEIAVQRFRLMPQGSAANPELMGYIAEHSIVQLDDGSWSWKFDEEGTARPFGADFPEHAELGMSELTCPTLFIYGEYSELMDAEEAQMTAGEIPNTKIVELAGTHHHLMFDRPHAFNKAILDYLVEQGI